MPFQTYFVGLLLLVVSGGTAVSQKLSVYRSNHSLEETTHRLISLIELEGLNHIETNVFDKKASGKLGAICSTRVVRFDESSLTSQLISCRPTTALELPLKILVWKENKDVYLGFMSPELMKKSYLVHDCDHVLNDLTKLLTRLVNSVIRSNREQ